MYQNYSAAKNIPLDALLHTGLIEKTREAAFKLGGD